MKNSFLITSLFCLFATENAIGQNIFPSSGNVGIGTLSPGFYALNINGSNNDGGATNAPAILLNNSSTFLPNGNGYNMSFLTLSAGNAGMQANLISNYGVGTTAPWNGGSGFYILTRTNHPIIFGTGSSTTEKMRLTDAGFL